VLFDLDGTLTDSKEGITKSVQYSLKKYGIIVNDLDLLEKFIGPPLKESFIKYYKFDELKSVQAVEYYREYFKNMVFLKIKFMKMLRYFLLS
jgi:Predicted phosphatases